MPQIAASFFDIFTSKHPQHMRHHPLNLVQELNTLQQGLNFLVPREWWNEFLALNDRIRDCSDLIIPSQHPLDVLIELGIIKISPFASKNHLISLEENAQKVASSIASQTSQPFPQPQPNPNPKTSHPLLSACAWPQIEKLGNYNKVMICGQLQQEIIESMLIDTFEWKVLNPSLYSLISQRQSTKKDFNKNHVIAIPIFLDDSNVADYKNEMSYTLGSQVRADVYFYNTQGIQYCAVGALENKITLGKMMKYLYEGMAKMSVQEHINPTSLHRNSVASYNKQIYYNFEGDGEGLEQIGWRNYNNIRSVIPIEQYQYIQFSNNDRNSIGSTEVQDQQLFKNCNPSKKIKQNEIQIRSVAEKIGRKRGFQPTIITNESFQQQAKMPAFHLGYGVRAYQIEALVRPYRPNQDYHSSTEEETPSFIGQDGTNQHSDLLKSLKKDETRIHFPLWRGGQNVHALAKLAQIKTNDFIPLPLSPSKRIQLRTKANKRVFLSGRCNKLSLSPQGESIQQQITQETPQIMAIPQEITKSLQGLALDIMQRRKPRVLDLLLIKQDPSQSGKQKLDAQSQTCKNEDIDDLDEVQSREC